MSEGHRRQLGVSEYLGSQVYRDICNRLYKRHRINFPDHAAAIYSVGTTHGQGIEFAAKDAATFEGLLRMPKFAPDNQKHLCDKVASLFTKGQGYREVGVPSLHIAVSPELCSVHIDTFGFVAIGPDGKKYFNPDSIQHAFDELLLQDLGLSWVTKHNRTLGAMLGHLHVAGPSSRNRYRLAVGGRVNVAQGSNWGIGFEVNRSLNGDDRYMGKVDVFGW